MRTRSLPSLRRVLSLCVVSTLLASAASAQLVISEIRLHGPNGANDEFIEIQNNTSLPHTVAATGTGSGYGVAASDLVVRCTIPNGTVIPPRGHVLCVNTVGYSLVSYPAGNGTVATADATYATDIPANVGVALFTSNVPIEMVLATRLDAIGSTAEANPLFKEGTGVPVLTPFPINASWVRDRCGKGGSITTFGVCPSGGLAVDTNDNAADFYFVDTDGTSAGGGQRLGAPGPENSTSPFFGTAPLAHAALDPCAAATEEPNADFDGQSDPAANATFGSLEFRRTFTNNTGSPITRLRFRIIDLTTFPAPGGIADLRARTSPNGAVTVDRAPCGSGTSNVTVLGTTLEEPPAQVNGGAFGSSLSAGTITLAEPLPNGGSVDLRFLFGLQQHGQYKLGLVTESLPVGGNAVFEVEGCTDGCTGNLEVVDIDRLDAANQLSGATVDFRLSFNETGAANVDASDFTLATTGTIAGATITSVAAEGGTTFNYIVTVNAGTGEGTLRLDLIDDDTIAAGGGTRPLGGAGAANGDYTNGEAYLLADPPEVVSIIRASPDPTAGPTVDFTVTFSESVSGVDGSDFAVTTTGTVAGASVAGVSGSGATRTVTVDIGTGTGTIRLDVIDDDTIVDAALNPLGGAGTGNGDFTAGQAFTVVTAAALAPVPLLDPRMLALLAMLLAAAAVVLLRKV